MNEFTKELEKEIRKTDDDYNDLLSDFEFVRNLNTEMANKYADLISAFPSSSEVVFLIESIEDGLLGYDKQQKDDRIMKLTRLKSACIALEKYDTRVLPQKYDDLEK